MGGMVRRLPAAFPGHRIRLFHHAKRMFWEGTTVGHKHGVAEVTNQLAAILEEMCGM